MDGEPPANDPAPHRRGNGRRTDRTSLARAPFARAGHGFRVCGHQPDSFAHLAYSRRFGLYAARVAPDGELGVSAGGGRALGRRSRGAMGDGKIGFAQPGSGNLERGQAAYGARAVGRVARQRADGGGVAGVRVVYILYLAAADRDVCGIRQFAGRFPQSPGADFSVAHRGGLHRNFFPGLGFRPDGLERGGGSDSRFVLRVRPFRMDGQMFRARGSCRFDPDAYSGSRPDLVSHAGRARGSGVYCHGAGGFPEML